MMSRDPGRANAHFRRYVAKAPDGVVIVAADGNVVFANTAAQRLLSRSAEELRSGPFGDPIANDGMTELDIVRDGEVIRTIELHALSVIWDDAPARMAVIRELDDRRERTPVRSATELGEDLAVASHELRTPLTTILGASSTLLASWQVASEDQKIELIESIYRQGARLMRICQTMLTLAQVEAGTLVPQTEDLPVMEATRHVVDDLGAAVNVRGDAAATASVDADHFAQILSNLLSNSMKYGAPPYEIDIAADDTSVVVSMIDHGPGIPKEAQDRLFVKYERLAPKTASGTGLGLSVARRLAVENLGDLWFEPNEPSGARFCLRLPVAPARS